MRWEADGGAGEGRGAGGGGGLCGTSAGSLRPGQHRGGGRAQGPVSDRPLRGLAGQQVER